jgi:hypothetical protein
MQISPDVQNKIPYIIAIIIIIYILKPNFIFKPNGSHREYGLGYDRDGYKRSIYSMHVVIILIVIVSYLFST